MPGQNSRVRPWPPGRWLSAGHPPSLAGVSGPADLVVTGADVLVAPLDLREGHDVVIRAGAIASVEPSPSPARGGAAAVIDGAGLLAMPGLVNAHTHSPENPLRGIADGLALEPWLCTMFGASGVYDEDDHYWCAMAGAVEMLMCGTTAVIDHLTMSGPNAAAIDGAMRAYRDVGIRGGVAPLVVDMDATADLGRAIGVDVGPAVVPFVLPFRPAEELIGLTGDAMSRWHGAEGGRLHVLAGPSGVQWASDALLSGLSSLARRHGTGLQIHTVETRLQAAACRHRFGVSGVAALDALGVLGPGVSLAHCVWIEPDDIALIAERGATVAHNPAANLRLRSGRAPVPALLDAGAGVAVGTDGAASSDDQSTWIAMRLAALVHRGPEAWVSGPQALAMATTGGGSALGVPGLGTLTPGSPADISLIDRGGCGLAGAHDLETSLVLSETGAGVRHVVVAGDVVVRDGLPTRVDLREVRAHLAEQVAKRAIGGASPEAVAHAVAGAEAVRAALAERERR